MQHFSAKSASSSPSKLVHESIYDTVYLKGLCGGTCVVVRCPEPTQYMFPTILANASRDPCMVNIDGPDTLDTMCTEVELGRTKHQSDTQLNVFMGGRIAMRRALSTLYLHMEVYQLSGFLTFADPVQAPPIPGPILANEHGAPVLPKGFTGSISHKENLAAAVALNMHSMFGRSGHIGIDIEKITNKAALNLAKRVLTDDERASLDGLNGLFSIEEEIMLRFSFKESIYKALHPQLQRYIEFHEAEVYPKPGGKVELKFKIKTGEQFDYHAEWRFIRNGYWLTCVHAWVVENSANSET